jgi:hypothetical protein
MNLSVPVLVRVNFAYTHDGGVIKAADELKVSARPPSSGILLTGISASMFLILCPLEAMALLSRIVAAAILLLSYEEEEHLFASAIVLHISTVLSLGYL